jgi:hypothetical protein
MMAESIWDVFEAEAVLIDNAPVEIGSLIARVRRDNIDAVIVDYKMRVGGYSLLDGIDVVAALVDEGIPAVLATSFSDSTIDKFVWHGSKIPAFVSKGDLRDTLGQAMEAALLWVTGKFTAATEPYPTVVRICALDDSEVGLMISGYSAKKAIMVKRAGLAQRLGAVPLVDGLRFMADVNLGAEHIETLYVKDPRPLPDLDARYATLLPT